MDLKEAIEAKCAEFRLEYIRLFNKWGEKALVTKKAYVLWAKAEEDALECHRMIATYMREAVPA